MSEPESIDPATAAVLVMDFQTGILANYANASDLINGAAQAIATARSAGTRVIFVRVAFTPQDYAAVPSQNKTFAGVARGKYFADGSPEAEIHSDLAPQDGDIVVTKVRFGAFSTTKLDSYLRSYGVRTLILAGLSTSGVVLSTLRDATDRDYRIVVIRDCCSDPKPVVNRALMDEVFPQQADVIQLKDLASLLNV